ncbi:hypothetical protein FJ444_10600 [Aestuariibacter sp. GS-14]|uniref:hypothetical protein n=1 Tax=Alteromonadaceae TaxID=72275 RepID=UPI001127B28B|nr:hypothetical protein [Aestuariibacter sp. GS-14]TPV58475.1 hypothetical protein FJ444_10600 [Aestuariibacter sp. GS-14]
MNKALLCLAGIAALLSGCTTLPTDKEIDEADYGSYPTDYENIVKTYYSYHLTHPDSIDYAKISKPRRYWLGNELDSVYYGYLVCATVNYRNMVGKDTGYNAHALLINNGLVVKYVEDGTWWGKPLCD